MGVVSFVCCSLRFSYDTLMYWWGSDNIDTGLLLYPMGLFLTRVRFCLRTVLYPLMMSVDDNAEILARILLQPKKSVIT